MGFESLIVGRHWNRHSKARLLMAGEMDVGMCVVCNRALQFLRDPIGGLNVPGHEWLKRSMWLMLCI